MTRHPPLLPEEAFARVLRVARLDGLGVLVVAAFFAVLSALGGDRQGTLVGLLIAGAGAMELHGATMLVHGDSRAIRWLVSSQLVCLLGILVFCAVRIAVMQLPPIPEELRPLIEFDARRLGLTPEQLMEKTYRLGLSLVAIVSIVYQGGMALYYLRRREAVLRAIESVEVR